jgi:hypothetical protein
MFLTQIHNLKLRNVKIYFDENDFILLADVDIK